MGTYWIIACEEKEEYVDFGSIKGNFTKYPVGVKIGLLLCYLNYHSRWSSKNMRYVADVREDYYIIKEKYTDITNDIVAEFNMFLYDLESDVVEEFILSNMLSVKS